MMRIRTRESVGTRAETRSRKSGCSTAALLRPSSASADAGVAAAAAMEPQPDVVRGACRCRPPVRDRLLRGPRQCHQSTRSAAHRPGARWRRRKGCRTRRRDSCVGGDADPGRLHRRHEHGRGRRRDLCDRHGCRELEHRIEDISWNDTIAFQNRHERLPMRRKLAGVTYSNTLEFGIHDDGLTAPSGFINTQNIEQTIRLLVSRSLGYPGFRPAADSSTGPSRRTCSAARWSCSIPATWRPHCARAWRCPGSFAPVTIGDRVLGDGGLTRNVPVDIARQTCADVVIVVSVPNPIPKPEDLQSPITMLNRTLDVLVGANERDQLRTLSDRDVSIVVDSGDITSGSFNRVKEAIPLGRTAALQHREELARYSVSEQEYAAWREGTARNSGNSVELAEVKVDGLERVDETTCAPKLDLDAGSIVDQRLLSERIDEVYALDEFDRVQYSSRERGSTGARHPAFEKPWGPNLLRFDVGLQVNTMELGVRARRRLCAQRSQCVWRRVARRGSRSVARRPPSYRSTSRSSAGAAGLSSPVCGCDVPSRTSSTARIQSRVTSCPRRWVAGAGSRIRQRCGAQGRARFRYSVGGAGHRAERFGAFGERALWWLDRAAHLRQPRPRRAAHARLVRSRALFQCRRLLGSEALADSNASKDGEALGPGPERRARDHAHGRYLVWRRDADLRPVRAGRTQQLSGAEPRRAARGAILDRPASYLHKVADISALFGQALYMGMQFTAGEMRERFDLENPETIYSGALLVGGRTPLGPLTLSLASRAPTNGRSCSVSDGRSRSARLPDSEW